MADHTLMTIRFQRGFTMAKIIIYLLKTNFPREFKTERGDLLSPCEMLRCSLSMTCMK